MIWTVSRDVISGRSRVGHQQMARFLLSMQFSAVCLLTLQIDRGILQYTYFNAHNQEVLCKKTKNPNLLFNVGDDETENFTVGVWQFAKDVAIPAKAFGSIPYAGYGRQFRIQVLRDHWLSQVAEKLLKGSRERVHRDVQSMVIQVWIWNDGGQHWGMNCYSVHNFL